METSVPFHVCAGLSALMYDIFDLPNIVGLTLDEILSDNMAFHMIHIEELRQIAKVNNLGRVVVLDTSWSIKGMFGSMNAATFQCPNGDIYVAFQGTSDGNWKYNADAAYGKKPSDMQKWALSYFDKTMEHNYLNQVMLYVTGHSQGGNNAMYVTYFSKYSPYISNCITIDAPGFSKEVADKAKQLWGEFNMKLISQKIFAVNGEDDYVHQQGEIDMVLPENTFYVPTPDAHDIGGFHDIFTHISNGKLNADLEDRYPQGELGMLMNHLVDHFRHDLSKEQRYQCAQVMMKVIENNLFGGGEYFEELDHSELWYLIQNGGFLLLETAFNDPKSLFLVMQELSVERILLQSLIDHPLVLAGLVLLSPFLIPLSVNTIVYVYLMDVILYFMSNFVNVDQDAIYFILNCLKSIKLEMDKIMLFSTAFEPEWKKIETFEKNY